MLRRRLDEWVRAYHCRAFIAGDPVQFPHRYGRQEDIEISGLLTALLSFGNRKMILRKAAELDELMGHAPLHYVLSLRWREDFAEGDARSFYRMLSRSDFRGYFGRLYRVYAAGHTLEDALMAFPGTPMQRLWPLWRCLPAVRRRSSTCFCGGWCAAARRWISASGGG